MTNKSLFESITLASEKQEGGSNYKMKIQPYKFIRENNLSFFQGNIIKYVVRYLNKNGIEDLKKIIHYCELEIDEMKRDEWRKEYD